MSNARYEVTKTTEKSLYGYFQCPVNKRLVGKKCYDSLLKELVLALQPGRMQIGSYYDYLLNSRGESLCSSFSTHFIPTEKAVRESIGLDFPSIKRSKKS